MLASLLGTQHINAQDNTAEYGIFNHLGAAVSVGTDGIGFDVASPLTNYVALRAGVSFWPKIKFSHNFRINDNNPLITDNVDVEAKTKFWEYTIAIGLLGASENACVNWVKCNTSCRIARALESCSSSVKVNLWSCAGRVDDMTVAALSDVIYNTFSDLAGCWVNAMDSYKVNSAANTSSDAACESFHQA